MDPRLDALVAGFRAGAPNLDELGHLIGEPPEPAAEAVRLALAHDDLVAHANAWLPPLLLSAAPAFAAQSLAELASRYRATRKTALPIAEMPWLPSVLGNSIFLARLLLRHAHWADEVCGDPPEAPHLDVEADWTAIRIAKYKALLRITARDLSGRRFEESLRELSDLADACLHAALQCTERELDVPAPALLALGKLGGRELNFSSDVDLLFLYESEDPEADLARNRALTPFVQHFKNHLEAASEDGFAYRIDLDLRPEGRSGVLANSVDAALGYYERFGRDWERQMLIRLRPVAGESDAAARFTREIQPFIYRQLIDPAAIHDVHEMKRRLESERRRAGSDLEYELKEGPGGIRDVEFLVQALQLLLGGTTPEIRGGHVLEALATIAERRLLEDSVIAQLHDAYLWLRRAEHGVQMVEERQTQRFPRDERAQLGLARRLGYDAFNAGIARRRLLDDWARVRRDVRAHFDALVLRTQGQGSLERSLLATLPPGPLLEKFPTVAAPFLEWSAKTQPEIDFSTDALRGLARVLATSPEAARELARNATTLTAVAAGDARSLKARSNALAAEPNTGNVEDLEGFLDALRIRVRQETLYAASLHLGGAVPFDAASAHLSIVAEWAIRSALALAEAEVGGDAGTRISVLGMGKLAGREMTYHSDLDLIFLFPDDAVDTQRTARVAQKVIAYLSTMTSAGFAYKVDARLRPSGRQGSLVSSFQSFDRYQRDRAATWEHMALLRARAIAGDVERAQTLLDGLQHDICARTESRWPDIIEMRARVAAERGKESAGHFAIKSGSGGLMVVDFLAAGARLEVAGELPTLALPSISGMLRAAVQGPRVTEVLDAYHALRRFEACARWVAGRAVESFDTEDANAAVVAELFQPGLEPSELQVKLDGYRESINTAYESVTSIGSIRALSEAP